MRPSTNPRQPMIQWRGRAYGLAEAGALAAREHAQGNLAAVADIYGLMLAKMPDSVELHNNQGAIWQMMQQYDKALASYDRAIALKPGYANAHFNRGAVLKKMRRQEEALASYDQAITLKPEHVEAYHNRGVLLQEMKRYAEALDSFDRVLALKPSHAEAHHNRGAVLVNVGDMAAAEKMFLKALELKPDFPDPLFSLASLRIYQDAEGADVKKIRALLEQPRISAESREQLYFSLGKIYDDCGRYDEAFECYRQANQIRNAQVAYKASEVSQLTDGIIEVFTPEFLSRPFPFASESQGPLFIVGMPRSGTTLLASILSNHPAVATAGELSLMTDFASRSVDLADKGMPFPESARHLTSAVAGRLIQDYKRRLRRDAGPEVPYVIDKNPLNFRTLGLIWMLFPNARIIHCTRDRLDTCLSNYFQRFPLQLDYAFDLGNIGHFYGEYVRLMEHWRTIPTLKMIDVSYEDMILHTESAARRALDFLGLPWDERCLAPHTNPNAVETASQWQVRQPIYHHALERWRHYEKYLAPLM